MYREIEKKIKDFWDKENKKALLITGARQIGKTYIIRKCAKDCFKSVIEINFIENPSAKELFDNFRDANDILRRISVMYGNKLLPNETVIFFDEVQECKEIVTAIKFLVEDGSYRYVLSGSLLGVAIKDIRSVPVGYMTIFDMYPLDIREFCTANGVTLSILDYLKDCFQKKEAVDEFIHKQMLDLFRLYLIVGGMPEVVDKYVKDNNMREVESLQKSILRLYHRDIAKYDPDNKLYLDEIFSLIPAELNQQNKRFILKKLNENFKFSRYINSFIWLKEAGVALPTYNVTEPLYPLKLNQSDNLFKLFLSDVGLLSAMYSDGIQIKILSGQLNMNFGGIYENVAAQEFKCKGFELYYYNSHKNGELDLVLERGGEILPIEIKSGKDYQRHRALSNIMDNPRYDFKEGIVFCNDNISAKDKITYYPIYMLMFLDRAPEENLGVYKPDLSRLQMEI